MSTYISEKGENKEMEYRECVYCVQGIVPTQITSFKAYNDLKEAQKG